MTLYELGVDCDIALYHPSINSGDPYGFVLTPDPTHDRSGVSIQREVDEEGEITIYIFFTIMIADDLINPDGSEHSQDRQAMYDMLLQYLGMTSNLAVSTVMGTWLGIGPIGHSATELHLVNGSFISLKLANVTTYHPPVDSATFLRSMWEDTPPPDDALTWNSSIWK